MSIIDELIQKTYQELTQTKQAPTRSRVSQTSHSYRFLVPWTNATLLRILIRKFTSTLPHNEHRTKTQLDDAGRSVVSNIVEGNQRPTTSEYLEFLGFSQASLAEIASDLGKCVQDGFLRTLPGSALHTLGLDLQDWKTWCQNPNHDTKLLEFPLKDSKGNHPAPPLNPSKILYTPLNSSSPATLTNLPGTTLTYEIFLELINKTDFTLKNLVISLERKLNQDQKAYQIEQARLKSKLRWQR